MRPEILVVPSPDGDLYYRFIYHVPQAVKKAVEMVLETTLYESKAKAAVEKVKDIAPLPTELIRETKLYKTLVRVGAIRERWFQN